MSADRPLWTPSEAAIRATAMAHFMAAASKAAAEPFATYDALHQWSIDQPEAFWALLWSFCGVRGERGDVVLADGDHMPGASFFPGAQMNFAENLLWKSGPGDAIVFRGEDRVSRRLSWDELRRLVSRLRRVLVKAGVGKGDRVAAMLPNMPEAIAGMLATNSLGAIWSSCSPDFGVQGVLDRFAQIEPKVFIVCDGYYYNGATFETGEKVASIVAELHPAQTLVVSYIGSASAVAKNIEGGVALDDALAATGEEPLVFERLPFSHPLYILFSSGTTGVPKCIVHSQGGALLQHLKEQRLHADLRENDRLFYFTTCGWMMWNWLASGLASGATVMLYDGSPFHPVTHVLFDYADAERISHFGTSPRFLEGLRKAGASPRDTHDLSSIRALLSTGSPLSSQTFEYVYDSIKRDVHLASVSGGTDIVAGFVVGVPIKPVWSGEIQGPALGMAVEIWDDDGRSVRGEKGELVCTKAFPSMPVRFWNDPDGMKYRSAYFERFENVWRHGDFAEWTAHGGMIIHGRSDAVLNPGGVRIGTAEIYNQVDRLSEVLESVCVAQAWNNDVRTVLFVRLADGLVLDEALRAKIRGAIKSGLSPRHVPARIIAVADIPRTKSGKISELAVRNVVHGQEVKNVEALMNPKALNLFAGLPELAQ
jgi:acetoacetyl-CoA synthetase